MIGIEVLNVYKVLPVFVDVNGAFDGVEVETGKDVVVVVEVNPDGHAHHEEQIDVAHSPRLRQKRPKEPDCHLLPENSGTRLIKILFTSTVLHRLERPPRLVHLPE